MRLQRHHVERAGRGRGIRFGDRRLVWRHAELCARHRRRAGCGRVQHRYVLRHRATGFAVFWRRLVGVGLAESRARRRPANNSFSTDPSLAYFGGKLYLAWTQQDQSTLYLPRIYVESETGGAWSPAGTWRGRQLSALTPNDQVSGHRRADRFRLDLEPLVGRDHRHAERSDRKPPPDVVERHRLRPGAAHGHRRNGDRPGSRTYRARCALTIDAAGRQWLAYETFGDTGLTVLADQTSAAQMFVANGTTSIASILASGRACRGRPHPGHRDHDGHRRPDARRRRLQASPSPASTA